MCFSIHQSFQTHCAAASQPGKTGDREREREREKKTEYNKENKCVFQFTKAFRHTVQQHLSLEKLGIEREKEREREGGRETEKERDRERERERARERDCQTLCRVFT